jgi:hypothetical protein
VSADRSRLVAALSNGLPSELASDLVDDYLQMRQDLATATLGRSSVGKFVESLVQSLQAIATGSYETKPDVDAYLRNLEGTSAPLADGLKIVAARVGRSMYTMRNKRSIAHKGEVDPSRFDLQYLVAAAQWILAELLRSVSGLPMAEAGSLVERVYIPVGGVVEDFGDRRLVLAKVSIPEELLLLLHSSHPTPVTLPYVRASLTRRKAGSVQDALRRLWSDKQIEGDPERGYRLTAAGFNRAVAIIRKRLV